MSTCLAEHTIKDTALRETDSNTYNKSREKKRTQREMQIA